jgi:hypothetical protein
MNRASYELGSTSKVPSLSKHELLSPDETFGLCWSTAMYTWAQPNVDHIKIELVATWARTFLDTFYERRRCRTNY